MPPTAEATTGQALTGMDWLGQFLSHPPFTNLLDMDGRLVAELAARASGAGRVLDVACGRGGTTRALASRFGADRGGRMARTAYALMAVLTQATFIGYAFQGIGKFALVR